MVMKMVNAQPIHDLRAPISIKYARLSTNDLSAKKNLFTRHLLICLKRGRYYGLNKKQRICWDCTPLSNSNTMMIVVDHRLASAIRFHTPESLTASICMNNIIQWFFYRKVQPPTLFWNDLTYK